MDKKILILNKKCPLCGQTAVIRYKPFCSKRCADIDLNRWLFEGYVVHTNEVPSVEELTLELAKNED